MEKKSKKKKILLGCLSLILIVLLASIGIILYVLATIFDDKPAKTVIKIPDPEALQSATEKLAKTLGGEGLMSGNSSLEDLALNSPGLGGNTNLEDIDLNSLGLGNLESGNIDLNNLENLENLDLQELLKKIDVGKVLNVLSKPGTLTLNKAEVNALIASGFTADAVGDFQDPNQPRIYDAWFDNGRFTIKLTFDSKIYTPFGSYCNIQVTFVPQVIEHHLKLDIYSAKIGDFSSPVSYLKGIIDSQLLIYEKSEDGKKLLKLIQGLKVDEDKVVLQYDFQELSLFLLEQQDNMQLLNNSSDISPEEIMKLFK